MIYLEPDDLTSESYQRFIDSSTNDFPEAIDKAELKAIGMVKTMLKGRYDVDLIFAEGEVIRDELLVDIITKITLFKIFRRNAARKLPSDIKEDYEAALKMLEKINGGRLTLELPTTTTDSGAPTSDTIWGNNTNEDFYI